MGKVFQYIFFCQPKKKIQNFFHDFNSEIFGEIANAILLWEKNYN
jgi:hypothetical protein